MDVADHQAQTYPQKYPQMTMVARSYTRGFHPCPCRARGRFAWGANFRLSVRYVPESAKLSTAFAWLDGANAGPFTGPAEVPANEGRARRA